MLIYAIERERDRFSFRAVKTKHNEKPNGNNGFGMQWTLFWALHSKRSQQQQQQKTYLYIYVYTEIIAHIIPAKLLVLVFFCPHGIMNEDKKHRRRNKKKRSVNWMWASFRFLCRSLMSLVRLLLLLWMIDGALIWRYGYR